MTDKERLERIIQMQYDGYTIWDMGENDLVWLIEQAERVQELEQQNKRYREALEEIVKIQENHEWNLYGIAYGIAERTLFEVEGES